MKLESRVERLEDRAGLRGRLVVGEIRWGETDEQAEARAYAENDIGPNDLLILLRRFSPPKEGKV
jgi:hypothetical protein